MGSAGGAGLDVAVIGAGVVGLAVGAALARRGFSPAVLERCDSFGRGASSRNSEVLHAGLYYAPGMLRTRLCIEGRREIYRLAAADGIPCARIGKLVVAVEDPEIRELELLLERGKA
ncbi:MAG: FAD-dependent oxidoreductase, partial [Planctomycetota bacterium]|nr:FAD-dependent oxidoreductase [Planctomycetota bacterium]